jgi:hypothetical protein
LRLGSERMVAAWWSRSLTQEASLTQWSWNALTPMSSGRKSSVPSLKARLHLSIERKSLFYSFYHFIYLL